MQPILDENQKPTNSPDASGEDVFIFPATVAQYRFWLLDQLHPGNPALNVPLAARLTGRLDEERLERVLNEIVKRHEILRISFQEKDGNLVQIIHSAKEIPLARFDVAQAPESERENKVNTLVLQEGKCPFNLAKGPLLRAGLIRLRDDEHILLLTLHHIGCDGWSNGVIIREVAQLYNALREGSSLPDIPLQYADFAVWQQDWLKTPAALADQQFWQTHLQGILPCLNLPTDYPRGASRSDSSTIHTLLLPAQLTDRLKSFCTSENLTPFMVFLTVYAVLLHRYSGQDDITIGTPVANRNQPDLEDLIGLFSNPLLMRLKFPPGLTLRGLVNQIKDLSLEVMEHQAYPFEKVVEEIQTDPRRSGLQWLQAYMVFQKAFMLPQEMGEVTLTPLRSVSPGAMFDWMLGVLERSEGIRLQMEYNTDLFEQATIDRVLHHFQHLLETVATGQDFPIDELPILTPQERRQLLVDWNESRRVDPPAGRFVHTQFEDQVARTPDAAAFQAGKNQASYAELNVRANQLAHFLQGQRLLSGSYVGLALDQGSIEFVISFLAVLKAGGCCVPLDLPNDAALLDRLVGNSQLGLIVIQENLASSLPQNCKCRIIDLGKEVNSIGSQPAHNPSVALNDEAPAWVSFTARSRNGAFIRHCSLSHSVSVAQRELGLTSQDIVALSLIEMLPALLSGAKLVGRTGPEKFNAKDWWRWVQAQGVTVAALPTVAWHDLAHFLHSGEPGIKSPLRLLAIGGSPISPSALLAWQKFAAQRIRLVDRFFLAEAAGAVAFTEPATETPPRRVSIIRPAPGSRIFLLDEHLQPVPKGVPGCLYVGSDHLATEYLAPSGMPGPEFVADIISGKAGSRLLKTGDTGRFLADGGIELTGRIEDLGKTNGFRLELSEIRTILFQHRAVWDAVLVPRKSSGKNGLVAYWINRRDTQVQPLELRAFLAERLPAYMVPDVLIPLAAWPMTPDGWLDYYSLPSPDAQRINRHGALDHEAPPAPDAASIAVEPIYVAPRTYLEQVLCNLWREVLKLDRVGVTDNFFALGGHSLLAVRLISEINKQLKTKLHVPAFFQNPTVEKLAAWLAGQQPIKPEPQLVSLQPGRTNGALFYFEASLGLCRLAELFETGPASFTTIAPLAPEAYRAAMAGNFSQLPSLETLAAPHVALIQKHSFSGPCILVGHSFGGLLAFEAAHQLRRAGRGVDLVLLLDTRAKALPWWQKLGKFTWKSGWESLSYRSSRFLQRWTKKSAQLARRSTGRIEESKVAEPAADDFHLPYAEANWEVLSKLVWKARKDYQFLPLESRAILFRAGDSDLARLYSIDGSLGWGGLFKGGLEIVDCPGNHLTLLKSPNVQILAQQFQRSIERLRAP